MNAFRLMWLYFRVGAMNDLQYRVNFFVQLVQSLVGVAVGLIGLWLVFSHTTELGGWTRPELLAVMGVHILIGGIVRMLIQPNMERLMDDIQQGTLDYALTKPEDAQMLISVRDIRIWQFVDVVVGLVVLTVAVVQLGEQFGLQQASLFVLALLLGAIMLYNFWLIMTTGAFWFVRMDQVVELFQGVYAAGRWPVGIYPGWLQTGLTFLVPVAFAVTVPAEALTNRLTLPTLALAFALAAALSLVGRLIWRRGLRRYGGASA